MIVTVEQTIQTHKLFGAATPVILMVSGGSDSTALAYLMHDLHQRNLVGQPAILHVNHKLREPTLITTRLSCSSWQKNWTFRFLRAK